MKLFLWRIGTNKRTVFSILDLVVFSYTYPIILQYALVQNQPKHKPICYYGNDNSMCKSIGMKKKLKFSLQRKKERKNIYSLIKI